MGRRAQVQDASDVEEHAPDCPRGQRQKRKVLRLADLSAVPDTLLPDNDVIEASAPESEYMNTVVPASAPIAPPSFAANVQVGRLCSHCKAL
jgi:hypothetical protein